MGRHSAPGSDSTELFSVESAARPQIAWGRHSGGDAEDGLELLIGAAPAAPDTISTDELPVLEPPSAAAAPEPVASPEPVVASESAADPLAGTLADLHLLRASNALRMRCAAAIVVPFVIFTAVLVLLRRTDVYLIWLWIPTVLAGALIGAFLDVAHRRLPGVPADDPDSVDPDSVDPDSVDPDSVDPDSVDPDSVHHE